MNLYLKFLTTDGCGPLSGAPWPLPTPDGAGDWMEVAGPLVRCRHGLHAAAARWASATLAATAYLLEFDGEPEVDDRGEALGRRARLVRHLSAWDDQASRLYSVDCAERVLLYYGYRHPGDDRPRQALDLIRRVAAGLAVSEDVPAPWAAGWAAGWAVAWIDATAADTEGWLVSRLLDALGLTDEERGRLAP